MKNTLVFLFLLFAAQAPSVFAQGYLNVNNFQNSYEINIYRKEDSRMVKCQAVRLHKDWFLTAAHCFANDICKKLCTIDARLFFARETGTLDFRYEADISTFHTTARPKIFLHPSASKTAATQLAAYDIALVNFPSSSEYLYKDLSTNYLIPKKDFMEAVKSSSELMAFEQALNGQTPPKLLVLKTETQKMLNRVIIVPSIWDGSTEIMSSQKNPVFFSPKHHFIYTLNFGIRQGISGAGVMTNMGELTGIVSSTASLAQTGAMSALDTYSFFSAFDDSVTDFIKKTMGRDGAGLNVIEGGVLQLKVVPEEYYDFTQMVELMDSSVPAN